MLRQEAKFPDGVSRQVYVLKKPTELGQIRVSFQYRGNHHRGVIMDGVVRNAPDSPYGDPFQWVATK